MSATLRVNSSPFLDLLARHGIALSKPRGLVSCIFHQEKTPSLSIDADRGVFYCFGCGKSGGVKAFALAVGEPWGTATRSPRERARVAVYARRREADVHARAILQRRKDTRDATLWADWGEANTTVFAEAELMDLFFRRPDLAAAFRALADETERAYAAALWGKMLLEQQYAGEVARG